MHISYSELKTWAECPFKRKLSYVDRVKKFIGNEFTAFGKALHFLCENLVYDKVEDPEDFFNPSFEKELESIGMEENKLIKLLKSWLSKAKSFLFRKKVEEAEEVE